MIPALLVGEAKVFRHSKGKTLYISIPSKMAEDSAFTIKEGDIVNIEFDKKRNVVVIQAKSNSKGKASLRS